jgi:hypothetical protein
VKHFECRDVDEAQDYAEEGGQALHTHQVIVDWEKAPGCFKREVNAGRDIAHLFDRDVARLVATVRRLGVKVVVVERRGQRGQHVDLCGAPLRKALAECDRDKGLLF